MNKRLKFLLFLFLYVAAYGIAFFFLEHERKQLYNARQEMINSQQSYKLKESRAIQGCEMIAIQMMHSLRTCERFTSFVEEKVREDCMWFCNNKQ